MRFRYKDFTYRNASEAPVKNLRARVDFVHQTSESGYFIPNLESLLTILVVW